jgi:hypothetical protein
LANRPRLVFRRKRPLRLSCPPTEIPHLIDALPSTSPSATSTLPLPSLDDPLTLLQHENVLLRAQNAHLFTAYNNLTSREAAYESQLQKHRAYHRVLEAELAKKAPSVLLWKNAAMKAYGLLEEKGKRVGELELERDALLEALLGEPVTGKEGLVSETIVEELAGEVAVEELGAGAFVEDAVSKEMGEVER